MSNSSIATDWYCSVKDGQSTGPFKLADVQRAAQERRLSDADLVWHQSLGNWQQAGTVASLRVPTIEPPPVATDTAKPSPQPNVHRADRLRPSRPFTFFHVHRDDRLLFVSLCGFAVAVALVPVAVLMSQYYPIFGGMLESIAKPWSPARRGTIPIHIVSFSLFGLVAGAGIGELFRRSKPAAMACIAGSLLLFVSAFAMCLIFGAGKW